MAPLISHLKELGELEAVAYKQTECFEAGMFFAKAEGILPAPEANHAVHAHTHKHTHTRTHVKVRRHTHVQASRCKPQNRASTTRACTTLGPVLVYCIVEA
jgi:predicted alternative tryptophan synthase beta-subunit